MPSLSTKDGAVDDPGLTALLADFCARLDLPLSYAEQARRHFLPLADWLAGQARALRCPVIGLQGLQGSGKSTLAALLPELLQARHGLRVVALSLDDFYLGHAERQVLARSLHPLLRTRGVPGTHEVSLALSCLAALRTLPAGATLRLPAFDKTQDDRRPPEQGPCAQGPVDLVLFEGWCLGVPPQDETALARPLNRLEAEEDPDGRWRRAVNARLREDYARLWAALDALVVLQAPGFAPVAAWRSEQERRAAAPRGDHANRLMDDVALARFLQHYERLSHHALATLPARAEVLLQLDDARQVVASRYAAGHRSPEVRS